MLSNLQGGFNANDHVGFLEEIIFVLISGLQSTTLLEEFGENPKDKTNFGQESTS